MEEKKTAKVVDLRPTKESEETPKKLSYEQLENIAHQLSEQAKNLYTKLQEANMANIFKRLDYLFKVVENSHAFKDEFVTKCLEEIEELMTVPEKEDEEESKDKPEE